jgi:hypothetical protein
MAHERFIGIDPGLNGAIALYIPISLIGEVYDIPILELKGKKTVDLAQLRKKLELMTEAWMTDLPTSTLICLEEPHSMPGQGVSSTFKFGRVLGQIEGILAGLQLPYVLVSPSVWKKRMGLTKDKDATRAMASQLMPHLAHLWPLKKHHDRAEAMLLAYYIAHREGN